MFHPHKVCSPIWTVIVYNPNAFDITIYKIGLAQLSQKERAAGCVSFREKWKTIFCRQYLQPIVFAR